jgi:DNA transformation protein and related proteins
MLTSSKGPAKTITKQPTPPFVAHCLELLGAIGSTRSKRMFGGWGLYVDGLFIALIAFDKLFLKVDDQSRPQFERAGCSPFVFEGQGRTVTMSYWTAPDEALDSPALMQPWARMAMRAALQAALATQAKAAAKTTSKTAVKKVAPKTAQKTALKKAPKKAHANRA